jgi:hypothetical protein
MANNKKRKVRIFVKNFPKETKSIYISGSCPELGSWNPENAIPLQYYQNEGTEEMFFTEIYLPVSEIIEYKYLNHKNWESVECGIVAQEIENRSITIKDENKRTIIDRIKGFRIQ